MNRTASVHAVWVGRPLPRCLRFDILKRTIICWVIFVRPIESLVVTDLSLSFACGTSSDLALAVVLSFRPCVILVIGKDLICYCSHLDELSRVDVEGEVLESVLAVRAIHHPYAASAAWTLVTAVSYTYRAAHTNVSFRIDQSIHATTAHPAHPITENTEGSIIESTRAATVMRPKIPAKIVRSALPRKPMILRKAIIALVACVSIFLVF